MSCNLTEIRLEEQKITRIRISTRNKLDATILFETRNVIILLISTKNIDKDI